jgi:hypothetical protein
MALREEGEKAGGGGLEAGISMSRGWGAALARNARRRRVVFLFVFRQLDAHPAREPLLPNAVQRTEASEASGELGHLCPPPEIKK